MASDGRPFLLFNFGKFSASIRKSKLGLKAAQDRLVRAVARALYLLANDWLAAMQGRAAVRTGALRAAGDVLEPEINGSTIVVEFGFNIRYARIRNQGGIIKPVRARMLAIPLGPVKTPRGDARYASPREQRDLFIIRLAGKLYLARRRYASPPKGLPKWANIELNWKLVPQVKQEGDEYVSAVVAERHAQAPAQIAALVEADMARGA